MLPLMARKLGELVVVVFAVSALTFSLLSLVPGDPAVAIIGQNEVTPERLAEVHAELGLDDSLPIRYLNWAKGAITGDLGRSERLNQDVTDTLKERIPVTAELILLAMVVALTVALPLGSFAAYRAGTKADKATTALSFALLSMPTFILAIALIIIFAVRLQWLPATGWTPLDEGVAENLRRMVLPVATLGLTEAAVYTRVLRSDMITVLNSEFIAFARAKGLGIRQVLTRHALRPASLSLLTLVGLQLGRAIAGAVVIEQIFALPGLGTMLFAAILSRDLVLVQGGVLVLAITFVVVNALVDMAYTMLDPRIRSG
ncbi:MAG: ABC transporter permease [Actinomycetia bacterium]|nr:ABC transporter permease [Actinomycetes bacterium]